MEDNVSKIKERLSVVDVIASYIKVQKSGANFKARCPFHNEKTPSFYISPERRVWHCFGCHKGGDMFTFVQEIEGVDFSAALRTLATRAGVEIKDFQSQPGERDTKSVLYEIAEAACRFFEKQLHKALNGQKALVYLKERGLIDQTILEWRLGFAPDSWRSLSTFLTGQGYRWSDIVAAGLAVKKERSEEIYDRFRSRIMFPVTDVSDRIIGFSGRIFGPAQEGVGKYINTPQTAIYDKGRVLYGLAKARLDARRLDRMVLVEGNIDAIMSSQAGVKNVVATSGTALTPSHLQLLQRYTSNLDFCFDSDQAGNLATRRGIGLALSQKAIVQVITLDDLECKDPADYVRKYGHKWQAVVSASKPVLDFYFQRGRRDFDLAKPEGKRAMVNLLAPLIQRLSSEVEKAHWVSSLAVLFRAPESAVLADIKSAPDDLAIHDDAQEVKSSDSSGKPVEPEFPIEPSDALGEAFLAAVLRDPGRSRDFLAGRPYRLVFGAETADILDRLIAQESHPFNLSQFLGQFKGSTTQHLEVVHLKSQEFFCNFTDQDIQNELEDIFNRAVHRHILSQLASLEFDIREAEERHDTERLSALLVTFSELSYTLNTLHHGYNKEKAPQESKKHKETTAKEIQL